MLHERQTDNRITILSIFFLAVAIIIIIRLFILQVINYDYYALFALNSHEIKKKLFPSRGAIYFQDIRFKEEYPVAVNREYYLIFASPRDIPPSEAVSTTNRLAELVNMTDEAQKSQLLTKLAAHEGAYVPVVKKADRSVVDKIKAANLSGVHYIGQPYRFYPEEQLGAPIIGFIGSDEEGNLVGRYGLEGYWEQRIKGRGGFIAGEKGALGSWITLAQRTTVEPENGPDLLLTIDRTLEYKACERLRAGMEEYQAKSAALVLMNPKTGAVIAMCSLPDFDPNNYSKVEEVASYNNNAIFTAYEPGSVFKPITMAAGLDLGLVTPSSVYTDPGKRIINGYPVRNSDYQTFSHGHGVQTMTQVLEKSLNTGVVWVEEQIGNERFKHYVDAFGFGQKTGIDLNIEVAGDVSSLAKKGRIFGANGSFGQGLTVTPLQIASAYSAIANNGLLLKPSIVSEIRYANGKKERAEPQTAEPVISSRAAKLLRGMLISVVENHYHAAQISHYYVAGKTGTAQIPERGRYSLNRTNHTFAGFAPASDPELVLVVKYEEPKRKWAEQTALPVFKDVMQFALEYVGAQWER